MEPAVERRRPPPPTRQELRAPIRFNVRVFLREFFYHALFPLTIPFVCAFEGARGLFRREFLGWPYAQVSAFGLLINLLGEVLFISWFFLGEEELLGVDVWIAVGSLTFRNLMIAIKHGFRSDYFRRLDEMDCFPAELRRSEEVVPSLLPAPVGTILADMEEAAYRLELENPEQEVVVRAQDTIAGSLWFERIRKRQKAAGTVEDVAVDVDQDHPQQASVAVSQKLASKHMEEETKYLAELDDGVPDSEDGESGDFIFPPIRVGKYAKSTVAAMVAHLHMMDSFEMQNLMHPTERRWFLGGRPIFVPILLVAFMFVFTPSLGRVLDGNAPFGSGAPLATAVSVLSMLLTFLIWAGFCAAFLIGVLLHSARQFWSMQRLGTIIDTPVASDQNICNGWQPSNPSNPSSSNREPPQDEGDDREADTSDDPYMAAALALTPRVAGFSKPFSIDLRFDGSATAIHALRRWIPQRQMRIVRRVEWLYALIFLLTVSLAIYILVENVNGSKPQMVILLPGAVLSIISFLSLLIYLGISAKHNELLQSHAHLLRRQLLTLSRDFDECRTQFPQHNTHSWTHDPESPESTILRKHTTAWKFTKEALTHLCELVDCEVADPRVGPKLRFVVVNIDRNVVRLVLSTTLTAVLFILQQTVAGFSNPFQ